MPGCVDTRRGSYTRLDMPSAGTWRSLSLLVALTLPALSRPGEQHRRQRCRGRADQAKPRFSAANCKAIRFDLRAIDPGIPNHQIGLTRISFAYAVRPRRRICDPATTNLRR